MDIREQIAKALYDSRCTATTYEDADAVLAIPDIKEALSLLDPKRQGKLVKLAEDQTLPKSCYVKNSHEDVVYNFAIQDILNSGFKRVETL
jgi:hypothetical protein